MKRHKILLGLLLGICTSVLAQNHPPVANAGLDQNVYTGQTAVLQGTASDPDGDPIIYWSWGVADGPPGSAWLLSDESNALARFTPLNPGDYLVDLIVADGYSFSSPDYITVHAADNLPPVAIATADLATVTVGDPVCFDGSQSYDPEGGPLSYTWDFGDGSLKVDGQAAVCHLFSSKGTFYVTLRVIDERSASDIDLVMITVVSPYGGGSGTSEDPYQIWDPNQMNTIGTNPNDWGNHFILMADIDMSAYTGTQYNVIGTYDLSTLQEHPFTGTFNGNGHVISNLTYTNTAFHSVGLFGDIYNATIQNLGLENVLLSSNVEFVSGLVGVNNAGLLIGCYAKGSVSGANSVGGLVGYHAGMIERCYAACSVSGAVWVGGLVGQNRWADVFSSYATGPVRGNMAGGLAGYHDVLSLIWQCYAACSISGTCIGGLVGENDSGLINAFWNIDISGTINEVGNQIPDPNGILGKPTTLMQTLSTFTSAGWDFVGETTNGTDDIWRMCCEGMNYPSLSWQVFPKPDFSCPNGVNTEDLTYYAGRWLMDNCSSDNNYCGGADLNYSGVVDLVDFSIFAENWLFGI